MENLKDMLNFDSRSTQDVLHYYMYIDGVETDTTENRKILDQMLYKCLCLTAETSGYIWQGSGFHLIQKYSPLPHLYGNLSIDDSITDEWFVVYLLQKISTIVKNVSIKMYDSDGEFLLIEAGLVLPEFVSPEIYDGSNRVFMRDGHIHIIESPSDCSSRTHEKHPALNLLDALNAIQGIDIKNEMIVKVHTPAALNECIQERLSSFPTEAQEYIHHQRATVPLLVSHLLEQQPQLISHAVSAFYHRDNIDMKHCSRMNQFNPSLSGSSTTGGSPIAESAPCTSTTYSASNCVDTIIRFNRCLFAQLMHQPFHPPRPYEKMFEKLGSDSGNDVALRKERRYMLDVGMRVSCGFEILYQNFCSKLMKESKDGDAIDSSEDDVKMKTEIGWSRFNDSLKQQGYYDGIYEGCLEYKSKERDAKRFFESVNSVSNTESDTINNDGKNSIRAAKEINLILKKSPPVSISTKTNISSSSDSDYGLNSIDIRESDSLDWMQVRDKELQEMLNGKLSEFESFDAAAGADVLDSNDILETDSNEDGDNNDSNSINSLPNELINTMQSFISKVSSHEGIEPVTSSMDSDGYNIIDEDMKDVEFDISKFMSILSGESEYLPTGTMSSGYINTENEFPRENNKSNIRNKEEEEQILMNEYMSTMDRELERSSASTLNKTFTRAQDVLNQATSADSTSTTSSTSVDNINIEGPSINTLESEEQELSELDLNVNLIENLLESFSLQEGHAGPVSNVLRDLGINLEKKS